MGKYLNIIKKKKKKKGKINKSKWPEKFMERGPIPLTIMKMKIKPHGEASAGPAGWPSCTFHRPDTERQRIWAGHPCCWHNLAQPPWKAVGLHLVKLKTCLWPCQAPARGIHPGGSRGRAYQDTCTDSAEQQSW